MERRINDIPVLDEEPINNDAWEKLREQIISNGGEIVHIGLLDDIDPNGGCNTACQSSLEEAYRLGLIIRVATEISCGIIGVKSFRIINPRLSDQSKSSFAPNSYT